MTDRHALLYRQPTVPGHFVTHLLATGEWEQMIARWRSADTRLRAGEFSGHVVVRSVADPMVPEKVSPDFRRMLVDPVPHPRAGDTYGRHHSDVDWTVTERGYRYWASCSCGYIGPVRVNPNDASAMAEDHVYRARYKATGKWDE